MDLIVERGMLRRAFTVNSGFHELSLPVNMRLIFQSLRKLEEISVSAPININKTKRSKNNEDEWSPVGPPYVTSFRVEVSSDRAQDIGHAFAWQKKLNVRFAVLWRLARVTLLCSVDDFIRSRSLRALLPDGEWTRALIAADAVGWLENTPPQNF